MTIAGHSARPGYVDFRTVPRDEIVQFEGEQRKRIRELLGEGKRVLLVGPRIDDARKFVGEKIVEPSLSRHRLLKLAGIYAPLCGVCLDAVFIRLPAVVRGPDLKCSCGRVLPTWQTGSKGMNHPLFREWFGGSVLSHMAEGATLEIWAPEPRPGELKAPALASHLDHIMEEAPRVWW